MISLETGHKDKGLGDDWKSVDLDGKAPSITSYRQIQFVIWKNIAFQTNMHHLKPVTKTEAWGMTGNLEGPGMWWESPISYTFTIYNLQFGKNTNSSFGKCNSQRPRRGGWLEIWDEMGKPHQLSWNCDTMYSPAGQCLHLFFLSFFHAFHLFFFLVLLSLSFFLFPLFARMARQRNNDM